MSFDLAEVMDALANSAAGSGSTRAYGWSNPQAQPPCVVVEYPTQFRYNYTAHALGTTGKVEAIFPVFYVVAAVMDKEARDALSPVLTGDGSLPIALDASVASVDICEVSDVVKIVPYKIGDVTYMAAQFDVLVVG